MAIFHPFFAPAKSSYVHLKKTVLLQKRFLVIGDYKKIWNRAKIFFLVRPQYCPPLSPPNPPPCVSASMQHFWGSCVAATVNPSVEITGSVVRSVACSVFRRHGPYIPYGISLMGLCCCHGLHTGRRRWKSRT